MQQVNASTRMNSEAIHEQAGPAEGGWVDVCHASDLVSDCGICVLIEEQGRLQQVAIFALATGALFALDNIDPIGGAAVLSRGITGSLGDQLVVASPLYKHHFNLLTGQCLEDTTVGIRTWPVRRNGDCIQLQLT